MPGMLISEFMDKVVAEGLISKFDVHWGPELSEVRHNQKNGRADGSWARQNQCRNLRGAGC